MKILSEDQITKITTYPPNWRDGWLWIYDLYRCEWCGYVLPSSRQRKMFISEQIAHRRECSHA